MLETMQIENWPVGRLVPYERNPRKNDAAVGRMAEIIRAYGFRYPILARSSGEIVDGHLRCKAAVALGLETVPVLLADDMTPEQVRAFRIAVNKSATFAEWDYEELFAELKDLSDATDDPTGFDAGEILELEKMLETEALPEEERLNTVNLTANKKESNGYVTIFIACDDIAVVEEAFLKTGQKNRAKALTTICEAYLDKKGQR